MRSFIITANDNGSTWDVSVSVAPRNSNLVTGGRYGLEPDDAELMLETLARLIADHGNAMPRAFLKIVGQVTGCLGGTWAP